jgi:protein-tyrosine phosphatase
MEHKLSLQGITDWHIDSAGTGSWHIGESPDLRSVKVANKNGIDISRQRARQFTLKDFDRFDVILAMDDNNYKDLKNKAVSSDHAEKIFRITDLSNEKYKGAIVPDPYFDGRFDDVFQLLDSIMDDVIENCTRRVIPKF